MKPLESALATRETDGGKRQVAQGGRPADLATLLVASLEVLHGLGIPEHAVLQVGALEAPDSVHLRTQGREAQRAIFQGLVHLGQPSPFHHSVGGPSGVAGVP